MKSIIIPVWNQHSLTAECITAIRETTEDYELVIVDNGSDPPIPRPYVGFIDVTMIRNEENKGFPVAVNQGIKAAKGETIILLNNDVIVTPGWADLLEARMDTFSIVGPMTNYAAGHQRITLDAYENKEELNKVATLHHESYSGMVTEIKWLTGFCFVFRKSLFDEIGDFDESMWPCSGEEIDFCYRAREKDHRICIANDVYVHHEGSVTFKEMESEGTLVFTDVCVETSDHLKKKWGDGFWDDQLVRGEGVDDGLYLNLGCGPFHLPGFINIDSDEERQPDFVCDILALPYEAGTVDEMYAGHILEHFDWPTGGDALRYWFRLLKHGGKISVVVPDYDILVRDYIQNPTPDRLREFNDLYIYSWRDRRNSPHKYAYSEALLKETMENAGFVGLKKMPVDHKYFPHPVHWQVGFEGVKP